MKASTVFDISLYGAIGGLSAFVAWQGAIDAKAYAAFTLGALVAVKAKRSSGSEEPEKPMPVTVENLPGDPVPVSEEGSV